MMLTIGTEFDPSARAKFEPEIIRAARDLGLDPHLEDLHLVRIPDSDSTCWGRWLDRKKTRYEIGLRNLDAGLDSALRGLLLHELFHARDELDSTFLGRSKADPAYRLHWSIYHRYMLIWNIAIDSRCVSEFGAVGYMDRSARKVEWRLRWVEFVEPFLGESFDRIWSMPPRSREEMLALAMDPRPLCPRIDGVNSRIDPLTSINENDFDFYAGTRSGSPEATAVPYAILARRSEDGANVDISFRVQSACRATISSSDPDERFLPVILSRGQSDNDQLVARVQLNPGPGRRTNSVPRHLGVRVETTDDRGKILVRTSYCRLR